MNAPLEVVLLMRPLSERAFSIEAVFQTMTAHLPPDIHARVVVSPYPSRGLLPRLRGILHAARATRGADVVHMTGDAHYLVLGLRRRRTVLTIHDCEVLDRSRGLKLFLLWLIWFRLPAWKSARITTVSPESRRQLLAWVKVDPDRVAVVDNPLAKPMTRHERAFSTAMPNVLMLGTAAHKNVERAVNALAGMRIRVTLIGPISGNRLETLKASGLEITALRDLSDVELAAAYAEADILLFPSLSEGFGLPILEAQAVGRPVISSDREPMAGTAGGAALLVDPENGNMIRAAVNRVIDDNELRTTLVAAGFRNVTRFTPKAIAKSYAELYRRVAADAGASQRRYFR